MSISLRGRFWLFLVAFFAVWTLRATVLYVVDLQVPAGTPRLIYSNAVKFALWVVPAWLYVIAVMRCDPWRYLRLTTPVNRRTLAYTAGGVAFVFGMAWVTALIGGKDLAAALATRVPEWPAMLASIAPSAAIEEVLFRGLVLQHLRARTTPWRANLAAAGLFLLVHWPYWLWSRGLSAGVLWDSVGVFVFACVAGYLVQRTESLWPGAVAHVANNFFASFV